VLVIDEGRIVEDGNPGELAQQENSRFHAMLEAEQAVREGIWSTGAWRRLKLEDGELRER
jgi:ATP-binding cassette subfamily B protein